MRMTLLWTCGLLYSHEYSLFIQIQVGLFASCPSLLVKKGKKAGRILVFFQYLLSIRNSHISHLIYPHIIPPAKEESETKDGQTSPKCPAEPAFIQVQVCLLLKTHVLYGTTSVLQTFPGAPRHTTGAP